MKHAIDNPEADNELPETFSLLCWNVHKEMGQSIFNETFKQLLNRFRPDLLALQEAVLDPHTSRYLPGYNFAASLNIGMRRKAFGVLSAGRCRFTGTLGIKTSRREIHIATRKSLLVTTHPLQNSSQLTVVNLHAINFVSGTIFIEEIERLLEHLRSVNGPLIVTGDFNTWSKKRLRYLETFAATIGLTAAKITDAHHIKQLFYKPLDHLYYRDLKLAEARAIDTGKVSDHNPIFARFSTLPENETPK